MLKVHSGLKRKYHKFGSSNTSCLEAHVDLFRMQGIFGPYELWPFDKKLIFLIVTCIRTPDYKVSYIWLCYLYRYRKKYILIPKLSWTFEVRNFELNHIRLTNFYSIDHFLEAR